MDLPTDIRDYSDEQLTQEMERRAAIKKQTDAMVTAKTKSMVGPLNANVKTVLKVNYSDLEDFVRRVFGVKLEAAMVEEMSNDTDKEYAFIGYGGDAFRNDGNDNKNVEDFLFGRKEDLDNYSLNCLLEWLAVRDFIPKGDYMVEFSW